MSAPVAETLTERLIAHLGGTARADAVFGAAVTQGDITVIPVARVGWGAGYGPEAGEGGGGGGVGAIPVGFIEIKNGAAQFRPIQSARAVGILAVLGTTLVCGLGVIGWAWRERRLEPKETGQPGQAPGFQDDPAGALPGIDI